MRIQAVNGKPVVDVLGQGDAEEIRGRWALRREYRSSYRDALGPSEEIVAGRLWAAGANGSDQTEVSLERGVARELEVGLGDVIDWDVQGVTVRSRVTSLREVRWTSFSPNFFAIFPTDALLAAPQTFAVLARLDDATGRARLQRSATERLPNVVVDRRDGRAGSPRRDHRQGRGRGSLHGPVHPGGGRRGPRGRGGGEPLPARARGRPCSDPRRDAGAGRAHPGHQYAAWEYSR